MPTASMFCHLCSMQQSYLCSAHLLVTTFLLFVSLVPMSTAFLSDGMVAFQRHHLCCHLFTQLHLHPFLLFLNCWSYAEKCSWRQCTPLFFSLACRCFKYLQNLSSVKCSIPILHRLLRFTTQMAGAAALRSPESSPH